MSINGLSYYSNYISDVEEQMLIQQIDGQPWFAPFKRRVQHYGYRYDYRKRTVDKSMALGLLPDWLQDVAKRVHADGFISEIPDQIIINEYVAGQGISPHIDCEPCFEDTILSLSLGSSCVMGFTHVTQDTSHQQLLEARSLVVLAGESRYDWKHGITARKSDVIDGKRVSRRRRISLTLRKVILVHSK